MATALAGCPLGKWLAVEELFARMRRDGLDPTVARSERGLWKLYLCEARYGSFGYAAFHGWTLLEGRYTLTVLFECAATLGLLDVAYRDPAGARDDFRGNWGSDDLAYLSRYDGLTAIRLTPLGSYALGLSHQQPPEPRTAGSEAAGTVTVLANHDIVALGEVTVGQRMLLSAFAEQISERVWRLSMASLFTAAGHGRRTEELLRRRADRLRHGATGRVHGPGAGSVTRRRPRSRQAVPAPRRPAPHR